MTVKQLPVVFAGADTHAATIHVAVISEHGVPISDMEFRTTTRGYAEAISFVAGAGAVAAFGIEGTSSYGAGITRAAKAAGLSVVEVNCTEPASRPSRGKSDPLDAYPAARAVAFERATTPVKDESIEGIRALLNARSSVKEGVRWFV